MRRAEHRRSERASAYLNAFASGRFVFAFWRDSGGALHRDQVRVDPCFFVRTSELSERTRHDFTRSRFVSSVRVEGDWTRISFADEETCMRTARPTKIRPDGTEVDSWIAERGIVAMEADVDPVRRWSIDTNVQIAKPRRCYLDIETDSRVSIQKKLDMRILCWAITDEDGNRTTGVLDEDTDADEKRLLEAMWRTLDRFDQVVAWNGDIFDFPVIEARTEKRGIAIEFRRWLWLDHLVVYRRMNISAAESAEEKRSFALEKVAQLHLGTGKLEGEHGEKLGARTWELWSGGAASRKLLVDYCAEDAALLAKIEAKTGYLELHRTVCEVCGLFPDSRATRPTEYVDSFLLRLGAAHGQRASSYFRKSKEERAEESDEQYAGAFVMDPTRSGILRDVHVADFAGLYPSIILSWNLSPETHRPNVRTKEDMTARPAYLSHLPPKEFPLPPGHCVAPLTDQVFATHERGILPLALSQIRALRKKWNKIKASLPPGTDEWKDADRRSTAYKIAANSFYGVVGCKLSRFFLVAVAESTSQGGVWLIKETMRAAEARGWSVVYGDTDSLFVMGPTRAEFAEFVAWCNAELYPKLLASKGCRTEWSEISLEAEKGFRRLVFLGKRRYVGAFAYYKGIDAVAGSKPEIKGLEFKRGDSLRSAAELQGSIVYMLLGYKCTESDNPKDYARVVSEWRERFRAAPFPAEDVTFSKGLGKSLSEYRREPLAKQPKLTAAIGKWVEVNDTKTKAQKVKARGFLRAIENGELVFEDVVGEVSRFMMCNEEQAVVFKTDPPHVRAARILQKRGRYVGNRTRVEYYFAPGEVVRLAEDYDGNFDRRYTWQTMVFEPTRRLLCAAFPGESWSAFEFLEDAPVVVKPRQISFFE